MNCGDSTAHYALLFKTELQEKHSVLANKDPLALFHRSSSFVVTKLMESQLLSHLYNFSE